MQNGADYHSSRHYDQTYFLKKIESGRPVYETRGYSTASIKFEDYLGQMAWIVSSYPKIRFVSFSDVDSPVLANDWKYRDDHGILKPASNFYVGGHCKYITYALFNLGTHFIKQIQYPIRQTKKR